jgi:triosephosphate isomerase
MSRIPMVAGNWKMNMTIPEAMNLLDGLIPGLAELEDVDRVVCPPFIAIAAVAERLKGLPIVVGAQNAHWEESGAYTGEIAIPMLQGLCEYVIIGHSERRQYFDETDDMVARKVEAVLRFQLKPIVCIGETLEEREAGKTAEVLERQMRGGLVGRSNADLGHMVFAYEPVWAIGTGVAATPSDAAEVIDDTIRATITELFGEKTSASLRILYGGSVKSSNADTFFALDTIDGALVGGASLKAEEFVAISQAAAR